MTNELSHRLKKFWKAYHANKKMLGEKKFSLMLKVEVYKSCIRQVLTYASQTWALRASDKNRLLKAERRIWCIMLIECIITRTYFFLSSNL
uniref:Reverse transcriptase n=1 Tax=Rhabditophanes sp. KR3021 TaxID=114890 RepID=A0AC35U701_9BILA